MQIIPAILAKSEEEFAAELKKIEEAGMFDWVHIDFCDGKFVPNGTVPPEIIKKYRTDLKLEIHLMVENPETWVERLGDKPERIIIHSEVNGLENFHFSKEIGLAFNPETAVDGKLDGLDCILIMGIHPGFQGREFLPETLEKIKDSFRLRANSNGKYLIGVDGGVSAENVEQIFEMGADYVVIGSHLIQGDINENFKKIIQASQS